MNPQELELVLEQHTTMLGELSAKTETIATLTTQVTRHHLFVLLTPQLEDKEKAMQRQQQELSTTKDCLRELEATCERMMARNKPQQHAASNKEPQTRDADVCFLFSLFSLHEQHDHYRVLENFRQMADECLSV